MLLNTYPLRVSQDLVFRSKENALQNSVSVMVYSLSGLDRLTEEMTVTVEGDYHLTILLDRNGVRVAESDCPGRDCVHTGVITRAGQSIVCLPEQVVVQLSGGGSGPDAVLG